MASFVARRLNCVRQISLSTLKNFLVKMAACKYQILARTFSSSAAQSQLIKTPIAVFGIGGRYASALYSAAVKAKEVDVVEKDLVKFNGLMTTDRKFSQIVKDPTIKKSLKATALRETAKNLSLSQSSANFLALLAENGRLKNFSQILMCYKIVMAAHRGEIPCEVTSAKPLTPEQQKDIEAALKKFAKGKQTILMTTKVDPKILGGLILSIGDKYVDMSIASKVKKYSDILKATI